MLTLPPELVKLLLAYAATNIPVSYDFLRFSHHCGRLALMKKS